MRRWSTTRSITRRQLVEGTAATALGFGLGWPGRAARAAEKVAPITVVINQSPWFESFRRVVELYEKESGNKVELDVNPLPDRSRSSATRCAARRVNTTS